MKRLVKLPTVLEGANVVPGTPSATRAKSSHGPGARARTANHLSRQVTHPFIRACLGTTTCGAGEDPP